MTQDRYSPQDIEQKWQERWQQQDAFACDHHSDKPKYYVLEMFPYPSGNIHMGHVRNYSIGDVVARCKRMQGFNVLHPMGWDAFGLPAENAAIKHNTHPAKWTYANIDNMRAQLRRLGYSYDWSREVATCRPEYYRWEQSFFLRLLEKGLVYRKKAPQNWCPSCHTVLANEQVIDGLCWRCDSHVEQKDLTQWFLRITAYGDELLQDLQKLEGGWPDRVLSMQRNWIGKSTGAAVRFGLPAPLDGVDHLEVFTTRPDTVFGVTFLTLAPEHPLVEKLIEGYEKADEVRAFVTRIRNMDRLERQSDNLEKEGIFTGAYVIHPFTGQQVPVWLGNFVLADYGTGAVMGVPAHDQRDFEFARKYGLPVKVVISPEGEVLDPATMEAAFTTEGVMVNSGDFDGMPNTDGKKAVAERLEKEGKGKATTQFRLRDWNISRQRYWGEPFPIYYRDEIARPLPESALPLELPPVSDFGPTEEGEPPLARAAGWTTADGDPLELSTMPGFAGSSAYYLRYMDPHNDRALVGREADEYWRSVDLYVGGIEHATGHLMYSRFWNMFLYDLGCVCEPEPFRKLVNQGMIQGRSNFVYRVVGTNKFVSFGLKESYETQEIHVDVNIVRNDQLDLDAFRAWRPEFADAEFILEDGKYVCGWAIEKMSKSMFNVVNPDYIVDQYGADTLRMYEMFLGPLEQSKPWDTNGIDGVHKFLRRFWRLFHAGDALAVTDEAPTPKELKTLHKTIKKVREDIENFSFNTSVAAFMICLNELGECRKRAILEPLVALLAPFAPHIAEELWERLGHTASVCDAPYPVCDESYLVEQSFEYPVMINGKLRFKQEYALTASPDEITADIVARPAAQKWLDGKAPKKVIVVKGKIINIVL